ncbi:FtsX-like permease family protein [Demequina sp. NBRC 110054]|uniref:FtsX-like permease family protein n=1 Tax=Demequina sp. NBRC 110054 TaxID=1570343 RepID=UPI001178AC57|nr:FtsX-like permease family protein [Demequina sp. NBRC 110054]
MIRQLMREQFRTHRTYLLWTTTLLTVAVAMASFATFSATQAVSVERHIEAAYGMDGSWHGFASFVSWDEPGEPDPMTTSEVADIVDAANAEGAGATALTTIDSMVSSLPLADRDVDYESPDYEWPLSSGAALVGEPDWGALLLDGDAPEPGEVVVSATWADELGVGIGDTVWAYAGLWNGEDDVEPLEVDLGALTVSGLVRDSLSDAYWASTYDYLLNWDTAGEFAATVTEANPTAAQDMSLIYQAEISADVRTPALDTVRGGGSYSMFGSITAPIAQNLAIAAGILSLGLIGMAFAVGRSQAQSRTGWVATARVLGVRRSSIVAATMLEVLIVGFVAGALGAATGAGIVTWDWARRTAAQPDAFVPAGVSLPWWAWLAMLGLALIVAGVIGGIPAFWAARVAPAAALKPVTPATQAEVSRTVRVWPLVVIWLATSVPFLVLFHGGIDVDGQGWEGWVGAAVPVLGLAALITTAAVTIEITRRAVRVVSRRVAAGTTPWSIAAGHALEGRPRQASGPASVIALAVAATVSLTTWVALANWAETSTWTLDGSTADLGPFAQFLIDGFGFEDSFGGSVLMLTAIGSAMLVTVALGAFLSLRHSTKDEADASSALGLDAGAARTAAAAQFGIPLLTGVAVGVVAGVTIAVSVFSYWLWAPTEIDADGSGTWETSATIGPWWALTHLTHAMWPVLIVAGIVVAWVGVGAGVAALTTRVAARPLERTAA